MRDSVENFLSKNYGKFSSKLWFHHFYQYYIIITKSSSIFFLKNFDDFKYFMEFYKVTASSRPFRLLFYFLDISYKQVKKIKLKGLFTLNYKSLIIFTYFVTNDGNFVTLSTLELFKQDCGVTSFEILNKFDKNASKWEKKLKFEDKFMDFNGCELAMLLPVPVSTFIYNFGYAVINNDNTDFKTFGLTPEIFRIAADKFNYIAAYQPVKIFKPIYLWNFQSHNVKIHAINGKVKTLNVMFDVIGLGSVNNEQISIRQTFMTIKAKLYSTPAVDFSPYEKFSMIFDGITWILLDIVIVCTILTALLAHRLSLTILNKTSFILVFTCLVFGIFYQNKSFKFMVDEPRRPQPKTFQDLIDGKYHFFVTNPIVHEDMVKNKR